MTINKTKLALGAVAGLAAGAAAIYLADPKHRKEVKKQAVSLQKKGTKVLAEVQKMKTEDLKVSATKKVASIKKQVSKKIKAVRRGRPLNNHVAHS